MKKTLSIFFVLLTAILIGQSKTILFIGDSITDGNWGSPDKYPCSSEERNLWDKNHILGHGYAEMSAGHIMGEEPQAGHNFINRGISGETLNQIASRWDKDAMIFNPDIISLLCGTNDIHYWLETHPKSIDDFNFSSYSTTLDSLIDYTIQRLPDTKIFIGTPFVAKAGYISERPDFELRKTAVDSLAQLTRNLVTAKDNPDIILVDYNKLLIELLSENPDAEYWIWDGIHPTTAMHYRMSKEWIEKEKSSGNYFTPDWESLNNYEVPEWFRDAKLGIWAHWGPQCVEGSGDWMARSMYQEGSDAYKYHVEHYGHPSEVGFKDILPLFKAENWNPDSLVSFYKSIGAKYFFVLGNHHDNFDLWDSEHQPWNSVNIGPKRDILAEWAAAAKKNDLPLGVSLHADHAWTWYEPSQRHDLKGEKAGIPYDGKLTAEDGKGKWWEGMDPQLLYRQNHELSENSWNDGMIHSQWGWENGASHPSEEFIENFYERTVDVINRYNPDLLYFDTTVLPFYPISDAGLRIASYFYNHNKEVHNDTLQAVMFGKILEDKHRDALVWDVERGAPNNISEESWQTCTCIGGWHYNTAIYENNWYKSPSNIVKLLADVVSKNGNLLLNVPLRADGTFDEKEYAIMKEFGEWMNQNGEAIYETRPWIKFGEGPIAESDIKLNAQGFNEGAYADASSLDIRFTTKGDNLYVLPLAWSDDNKVFVKSIDETLFPVDKTILLGYGEVEFSFTPEGMEIILPSERCNNISPVIKLLKK